MDGGTRAIATGRQQYERVLPLVVLLVIAGTTLAGVLRPGNASAMAKGVVSQAPLSHDDAEEMEAAGVQALRFTIFWSQVQRERHRFDWGRADRMVKRASEAGAEPIPVLFGTPPWINRQFRVPPIERARGRHAWRRFIRKAVRRYGPGGKLASKGVAPVRRWQVWNEPNIYGFWRPRPSPRKYAELLAITSPTIRSVDRRARIISAGLAPANHGIRAGRFLRELLAEPGVRTNFDLLAIHPYAPSVAGAIRRVGRLRRILNRNDLRRMPMMITEIGWSDEPGGAGAQAAKVKRLYRRLGRRAHRWRIKGVLWYAWQDIPDRGGPCGFCPGTGLVDIEGNPKPALAAFTRAR